MTRQVITNFVAGSGEGAYFPGGLRILAGTDDTPPNQRRVRWVREDTGALTADIFSYSPTDFPNERNVAIRAADPTEPFNEATAIGLYRNRVAGQGQISLSVGQLGSHILLDYLQKSNFIQLGPTTDYTLATRVEFGQVTSAGGKFGGAANGTPGWTPARVGLGNYTVTLSYNVAAIFPFVIGTTATECRVHATSITPGHVQWTFFGSGGAALDNSFFFLIISRLS